MSSTPEIPVREPSNPLERSKHDRMRQLAPWVLESGPEIPSPPVGAVPLVSYFGSGSGRIWLFGIEPGDSYSQQTGELTGEAKRTWDRRVLPAVSSTLPLLWSSPTTAWKNLRDITDMEAEFINALYGDEADMSGSPLTLDGPSVGLGFALAFASHLLDKSLPGDIVASAAIDKTGSLDGVDGLAAKLQVVETLAPGLEKFLVSTSDRRELKEREDIDLDALRVEVVGVDTVREALSVIWGDKSSDLTSVLESHLLELGADPNEREAVANSLLTLARGHRRQCRSWTPVRNAAECPLEQWSEDLEPTQREKLEEAANIARRFVGDTDPDQDFQTLPEDIGEFIDRHGHPSWFNRLAQLIQQSTDTGYPSHEQLPELYRDFLDEEIQKANPDILQALGAWGRHRSIRGYHHEALELAKNLTEKWCQRSRVDSLSDVSREITYPLSEWYRLSGTLEDEDSFLAAESLTDEIEDDLNDFDWLPQYIAWPRARALFWFGRGDEAHTAFEELKQPGDPTRKVAFHVRCSCIRYLARLHEAAGRNSTADDLRHTLRHTAEAGQDDEQKVADAALQLDLLRLDRALAGTSDERPKEALERLKETRPYPATHLVEAVEETTISDATVARYVSRHFPY